MSPDNETVIAYLSAVLERDYSKIEEILDSGVDVGICSVHGNTAMRNASLCGDTVMLDYLLARGADVNQRSNYCSPVDKRFEEGFTPVFYAHDAETLKHLVDAGADINAVCKAGYTALMKCCKYANDDIVSLVEMHLLCGADVSIQAPIGKKGKLQSALDIAKNKMAFFVNLYSKDRNENWLRLEKNSDRIIALLSGD